MSVPGEVLVEDYELPNRERMPFYEDVLLENTGATEESRLVVLGIAGAMQRDGETVSTFTAWVEPIAGLTPEELEMAVYADEFIDPRSGHLNLPHSPDELLERLVA